MFRIKAAIIAIAATSTLVLGACGTASVDQSGAAKTAQSELANPSASAAPTTAPKAQDPRTCAAVNAIADGNLSLDYPINFKKGACDDIASGTKSKSDESELLRNVARPNSDYALVAVAKCNAKEGDDSWYAPVEKKLKLKDLDFFVVFAGIFVTDCSTWKK